MKKLVLILLAGISFATARAQGQFQFGVKGGLNVSNVTVSNGFNGYTYSSLANFNAGVFLKIPFLAPGLSLQPEIYYSGQGFRSNDGSTGEYSEHVNYLNIPVLAKYTWPGGFFLETGPQLGLKLTDIKILLVTHAHSDHAGGNADMKKESGAKIGMVSTGPDRDQTLFLPEFSTALEELHMAVAP